LNPPPEADGRERLLSACTGESGMSSLKLSAPRETCPFHPSVQTMLIKSSRSASFAVLGGRLLSSGPIVRALVCLSAWPHWRRPRACRQPDGQVVGARALIGGRWTQPL